MSKSQDFITEKVKEFEESYSLALRSLPFPRIAAMQRQEFENATDFLSQSLQEAWEAGELHQAEISYEQGQDIGFEQGKRQTILTLIAEVEKMSKMRTIPAKGDNPKAFDLGYDQKTHEVLSLLKSHLPTGDNTKQP